MSQYQSQLIGQGPYSSNFIVPVDDVLVQKVNPIIDQRDYIGYVRQTSEGVDEKFYKKRSQPPQNQIYNNQQNNNGTPHNQFQTPAGVNQSITPANPNIQSQSVFQSVVPAPSALQSQIKINNQGTQLQNVPISQSYVPERQKAAEYTNNQYPQSGLQSQQQLYSQQQTKPIQQTQQLNQSYQHNSQIHQKPLQQQYQQQQQPAYQSQQRLPANPVIERNNFDFVHQGQYEDLNTYQQRNNISNNRINQTDNQRNRQSNQQMPSQYHQDNQQQNNVDNKNFMRQNSQFPPSHQYYNSALLEELNPYIPNQENDESELHYYAKFFEVCGHSLDSTINDEQAFLVLNTSVAQFDLEVMQQLKDELGNKEQYTVREFLNIYIKAINILEYKKMKEENIIRAAKDKLSELISLQEQARINEQNAPMNRPSILYIYVDEAKGLDRQSQYIVRINFDSNQMIQTNPSNYSSDPQFYQEFKLRVNNPNTVITFAIEDKNSGRAVGFVTQKLKQFYHQKKIDEWYILEDQGGALGDINKQIALAIQWVHSERLLYENILRENDYFEPVIKDQEEKLQDSIEMIRVLKHPFERNLESFKQEIQSQLEEHTKKAKKGKKGEHLSHNNDDDSDCLQDCWNGCLQVFKSDDQHHTAAHSSTPAAVGYAQANTAMNNMSDSQKQNIESIISLKQQLLYAYTILAVCVCFFRPNFIDVCLALVLLSNFFILNPQNCNKLSIALVLTILIDILWMSLFTKNWFSYAGDSKFIMILFIMIEIGECMVKVVLGIILQKIRSDLQDQHQIQIHNQQPHINYDHV